MRTKLLMTGFMMALALPVTAKSAGNPQDPYVMCTFYPAPGICDEIYRRAADDNNPMAASVVAEYQWYVRYLNTPARDLSADDLAWLSANAVTVPDNLTPEQIGGLHALMNDTALQKDTAEKYRAVSGYLGRAVQAHLYCVFNACPSSKNTASNSSERAG